MKNRTAKAIDFTLGIFAVIFYAQIRLVRALQLNKGLPAIKVWSQEPEMVKKDITLLSAIWLNTALIYFFGFWVTLIIFVSIVLGVMIKKKFFPILVLGFLAFSCSKEANKMVRIDASGCDVIINGNFTQNNDTLILPKKNTYEIVNSNPANNGGVFRVFVLDGDYMTAEKWELLDGKKGNFKVK